MQTAPETVIEDHIQPAPSRAERLGGWALFGCLMVLGFFALGLTIAMNWHQGMTLGVTEFGMLAQALSHVFVDCMAAALALVVGYVLARGQKKATAFFLLCTIAFAGYSMYNVVGFGASERIGKSEHAAAVATATAAAVREQNREQRELRLKNLSWLHSTYTKAGSRAERRSLSAESRAAAAAPVAIAPVVPVIESDQQARVMAEMTSMSVKTVQLSSIAAVGILLVLGKVLAFSGASYVMPRSGGAPAPRGGQQLAAPVTAEDRPSVVLAASQSEPERIAKGIEAQAAELTDDEQVAAFFDEATERSRGNRILASAVYQHYTGWAAARGMHIVSLTMFGRIARRIGVRKGSDSRHNVYMDISLIDGDSEAPQLKVA